MILVFRFRVGSFSQRSTPFCMRRASRLESLLHYCVFALVFLCGKGANLFTRDPPHGTPLVRTAEALGAIHIGVEGNVAPVAAAETKQFRHGSAIGMPGSWREVLVKDSGAILPLSEEPDLAASEVAVVRSLPPSLPASSSWLQGKHQSRKRKKKSSRFTRKLSCGTPFSVPGVPEDEECPPECPFLAEDATNASQPCHFQCVTEGRCSSVNPNATIADKEEMVCRSCQVEACEECLRNGEDVCKTCSPGYELLETGICEQKGEGAWVAFLVLLSLFTLFTLTYCGQLCCRPVTNGDMVRRGLRHRWRSRLQQVSAGPLATDTSDANAGQADANGSEAAAAEDSDEVTTMNLWPLATNLCRANVGGPGLVLYFNFQCLLIVWILLVLLGFCSTAMMVSTDLFTLGIRDADSPRALCYNVNWGHNTQVKFMYAKVSFMFGLYVVTCLMVFIHAILQFRRHQEVDDSTTMKDFCAYATGLPEFHGAEMAEERVKQVIEAATGVKVAGVSLCWNFAGKSEKVLKSLEYDMHSAGVQSMALSQTARLLASQRADAEERQESGEAGQQGCMQRFFQSIDNGLISWFFGWEQEKDPEVDEEELVKNTTSHSKGFIIFNDEAGRDAAVAATKRMPNGIQFEGSYAKLYMQHHEPNSVEWQSFGHSRSAFYLRLAIGLFVLFIGLILWAGFVYVPNAYYFTSYPYANGDEPSVWIQIAFTWFVLIGNEILKILTRAVCEWVGFRYKDAVDTAFLVLYSCSCFLCVILDLVISCFMTYRQLERSDAFTHSGKLIVDLSTWKEVFESYPMQKALGWELFLFAFPMVFLVPFILDPLVSILTPYWIGKLVVGSRPDMDHVMAEKCLGFTQAIDLSRYADLTLNLMLAIVMFFFPDGYTMITFTALFFSHLYIYALDHWKTLRAAPSFCFSSAAMDVSASAFMSVPLALLLCAIIFKFHDIPSVAPIDATGLIVRVVLAFVLHITIHVIVVLKLVPKLGKRGHIRSRLTYPEAAKGIACSWFTANPMHCLRSRYLYRHSPPCTYYIEGKEHLIKANSDIGVYFEKKGN